MKIIVFYVLEHSKEGGPVPKGGARLEGSICNQA